MVEFPGEIQQQAIRAKEGDVCAAENLLTFAYQHLDEKELLLQLAPAIDAASLGLSPRGKYALACILLRVDEGNRSFELLRDLAWDEGFGPAQWRLGRMIVFGEVEGFERELGFDLLETARSNGHVRALQSILVARSCTKKFPISECYRIAGFLLGIRAAFIRRILKRNDETTI